MGNIRPNPFLRTRDVTLSKNPETDHFSAQSGQIRLGTPKDLRFVDHVQRKFADCLGFLPSVALENLLQHGHIRICNENGDAAGYLLSRPQLAWQPLMRSITQAAVAMDAQRRHHGLALVKQVELEAIAAGKLAIQACCAVGLDSNDFWRAAGFLPIAHLTPQTKSGREIICWRKALTATVPRWFADLPERSGHRASKGQSTRDVHRLATHGTTDTRFLTADHG